MARTGIHSLRLAVGSLLLGALVLVVGCGGSKTPAPPAPGTPAAQQGAPVPAVGGAPAAPPHGAVETAPQKNPSAALAMVDGRPITVRQVYGLATAYQAQLEQRGTRVAPEQRTDLLRMVLQRLINSDLMARAAKELGQKVDPKILDERLKAERSRFPNEEAYRKSLEASMVTEEQIRTDLETQLLADQWARSKTENVKVDPDAVRKVYESNKDKFRSNDEAHVLQILVAVSPSDPPAKRDEARKGIEEAYAKAKAGEDFGKLADQYSRPSGVAPGGDVGFIPRGATFPQLDQAAFSLPIGQVSPVFETDRGYNVIKVQERRSGKALTWDEVKDRLTENVTMHLKNQTLDGQIALLRSKAKVSILDPELAPPQPPPPTAQAAGAPGGGR
jgi:parvulin-like peptidyl-prolyl isomerase